MQTSRIITLSILSAVLLSLSGLFAFPAVAKQLDSPFTIETFPVAGFPEDLASDGANIWITLYSDNSVTKLRASDGTP